MFRIKFFKLAYIFIIAKTSLLIHLVIIIRHKEYTRKLAFVPRQINLLLLLLLNLQYIFESVYILIQREIPKDRHLYQQRVN